jgi:hypothetical protein
MALKEFEIGKRKTEQFIKTTGLDGILRHPRIDEILSDFGSVAVRGDRIGTIDVIPPVPNERLNELGQVLVDFAESLDSSPPPPSFRISQ